MAVNLGAPDSENPKRKRKRRKLLLDAKVEVRSLEEGFLGSWHPGTVIACEDGFRHVKYHHLLRDDGSENLVDVVAVSPIIDGIVASNGTRLNYRGCIRPLPPMINFGMWGLHYGLCVDAFFKEAWWEGVIFDHEDGLDERKIFFPDLGDEEKIGIGMLRITHDWDEGTENWERRGNWLFLELIEEYELERPLVVSVKQIWYDLQEKKGFRKVGEWTSSKKALWKELVLEVINDNLELTVNEISCSLDFFGDSVPQPVLELPEPALDVVLDPESNLANACAVVPFENNRLLDRDMIVDHGTNQMTLLGFSIKDVDKRVENGLLATGMPHTNLNSTSIEPIEERSDPDGLISAVEDDGLGVNLVTYSNMSCQDKAIGVQQQELSVIPSNLDGISSISFNTKSEGFSSVSCRKSCRKSSTCGENPNWELPDGCNTLTGAEYCPGAITEYALSKMANKRPGETLTKNVRKHLSFLRWEIKCKRYKDTIRMRYTSPEGKIYYSLYQLCQDLREVDKILSPVSIDDQRSLPTSPDDLPSSPVIEQPQVSKEMTKVPPPDNVLVEPEYCPQAVVDWYILGDKQRSLDRDKRQDMILKAKKHLSAVGWVFCYANKKGKHELRYKSPRGKCYISLQKACKGFIDEGGVSESNAYACRPAKSAYMSAEAEVHLANEKLSSAITGTEYEGSLVPQNLPFEKRLALYPGMTQSNELACAWQRKSQRNQKTQKEEREWFVTSRISFASMSNTS
ncbi:hypothetical protein L1049_012857 [Liquidambar formosana]|uniref:Agenet domain-containing protein n=1 Tax=Liquidambar formosana TaxID=63359 RepID=A0AAP0RJF6_LIQFO